MARLTGYYWVKYAPWSKARVAHYKSGESERPWSFIGDEGWGAEESEMTVLSERIPEPEGQESDV